MVQCFYEERRKRAKKPQQKNYLMIVFRNL